MKASIEITFTPLEDKYEIAIKNFIRDLRNADFRLQENPLSTQIYGELQPLMLFLTQTIEKNFNEISAGMVHLKIVKSDRSSYVPFS